VAENCDTFASDWRHAHLGHTDADCLLMTAGVVPRHPADASEQVQDLVDRYAVAFRGYLSEPAEFALVRAYELGREALTRGLGLLEMATVHSVALVLAFEHPLPDADRERVLEASEKFFVEALSPFEMAHRGFREANGVLRRLNEMLEAQSKRIAYALHDEAAQLLVPLHLGLADVARKVPAEIANELQAMRGLWKQRCTASRRRRSPMWRSTRGPQRFRSLFGAARMRSSARFATTESDSTPRSRPGATGDTGWASPKSGSALPPSEARSTWDPTKAEAPT